MSAADFPLASASNAPAHYYLFDEANAAQAMGDDQICDILGEDRVLWFCCTMRDAKRLMAMHRSGPDADPEWQGALVLRVRSRPRTHPRPIDRCRLLRYADGLPLGAVDGCEPLLRYTGGTFGLGSDWYNEEIHVVCGGWSAEIDLQLMLFNLDRFEEPSRYRLTLMVESIFGVLLSRAAPMAPGRSTTEQGA